MALLTAFLPIALAASAALAEDFSISGHVLSAGAPQPSFDVRLYRTSAGGHGHARLEGRSQTGAAGGFTIQASMPDDPDSVLYLVAEQGPVALATVLGPLALAPSSVVVNERTTVATAFALAQFIRQGRNVSGNAAGVRNGAAMLRNLVDIGTGELGSALKDEPNGLATSTLPAFNTLANMVAACADDRTSCRKLFRLARPPLGLPPTQTLQAVVDIARHPGRNVDGLYDVAKDGPRPFQPELVKAPDAWTLALRFYGDGKSLDGPGNFAIDEDGNVWVNDNYQYSPPGGTSCAGRILFEFLPDGSLAPGAPFSGGGLSGAGFGISLAPDGKVWVANFGFEAPACSDTPERAAHDSVSVFEPDGTAVSPDVTGYTAGDMFWPQSIVPDQDGNIWIANCGNDSVTLYPKGDPNAARHLGRARIHLHKPFGIAIDHRGWAWVSGNGNDAVTVIARERGRYRTTTITGGGISRPMGIVSDSRGNIWVANSGVVDQPCPSFNVKFPPIEVGGSLTLLRQDGRISRGSPYRGGGIVIPWGLAVDGDDHVWVANFGGGGRSDGSLLSRISEICGTDVSTCPPGTRTGDPISPATGYTSDALGRITGIAVDPTGNVWAADNWKFDAEQSNPGGYYVVAFLGIAAPVSTPLIGPPVPADGRPRPFRFPLPWVAWR